MEQYTQVPNIILDEWMKTMHASSFMVLMVICRKTLGWRKEYDKISISQIMELTGLSNKTITLALKELTDKKLIINENPSRQIGYFKLNITDVETTPENITDVDSTLTGVENTSQLVSKLHTQKKYKETIQNKYYTSEIKEISNYWNSYSALPQHKNETIIRNSKKKHSEIIKELEKDNVIKAIWNYNTILYEKEKYFFSYKWNFWEFIERGVYKFLDSADPLNNYKIKDKQSQPKQQKPSDNIKNTMVI